MTQAINDLVSAHDNDRMCAEALLNLWREALGALPGKGRLA